MSRKSVSGFAQISLRNLHTLDCDMETSEISDAVKDMLHHIDWDRITVPNAAPHSGNAL